MQKQCSRYQITINHPIEHGYNHEHIREIINKHFKTVIYFCMADEEGSCYHTHIFIVFSSRVRFSMVKKYFPDAHIEACKGSVSDNVSYVKKSGKWELNDDKQEKKIEGTFEEVGSQPPDSRGRKMDMSELYQMIYAEARYHTNNISYFRFNLRKKHFRFSLEITIKHLTNSLGELILIP